MGLGSNPKLNMETGSTDSVYGLKVSDLDSETKNEKPHHSESGRVSIQQGA